MLYFQHMTSTWQYWLRSFPCTRHKHKAIYTQYLIKILKESNDVGIAIFDLQMKSLRKNFLRINFE